MQEMKETLVISLGQEDFLEEEMTTHSSILSWEIPWEKILVCCGLWGHKELDMPEPLGGGGW